MPVAFVVVCPSHSAMIEVDPGLEQVHRAVCRSVCGVTFFVARVGQVWAALATCLASRSATASDAQPSPGAGGEHGVAGSGAPFGHPVAQASAVAGSAGRGVVCGPCRSSARRAGAEDGVGAGERRQLGDP